MTSVPWSPLGAYFVANDVQFVNYTKFEVKDQSH